MSKAGDPRIERERPVVLSGWLGRHPTAKAVVAHLLISPSGEGMGQAMHLLAATLQLARTDEGHLPTVPASTAWIGLAGGQEGRSAYLHHGFGERLPCPVTPEWEAAASRHGMAVVAVGVDTLATDQQRDLSLYLLAYGHRAYIGLVPVDRG